MVPISRHVDLVAAAFTGLGVGVDEGVDARDRLDLVVREDVDRLQQGSDPLVWSLVPGGSSGFVWLGAPVGRA